MTDQLQELRWRIAACDFYTPLKDPDGWQQCPKCGVLPRVWVFDNGNYAKCLCSKDKYGPNQAEAPSCIEACFRQKRPYSEYEHMLRTAWNSRCQSLAP